MRADNFTSLIRSRRALLLLGFLITAITPVKAERLPIKIYTTADGLVSNRVSRIVPDSRGYLWFGTDTGLSRLIPEPDNPQQPPSATPPVKPL